jgi:hypothetical protein
MTPVHDPIERLRAERPELSTADPLATPRISSALASQRRRRPVLRVALVAAVALTAVLTGVLTTGDTNGGRHRAVGISTAEAREQAISALRGVARLKEYTSTSSWTATEVNGKHRVSGGGYTYTRVGGAVEFRRWSQADFARLGRREGMLHREIGTYRYEEVGDNAFLDKPWAVDARTGWHVHGGSYNSMFMPTPPPNFGLIISQLERERLIDGRRESDGTTIVTISRPARELAPVTGTTSGNDPIAMFAMGFASGRDAPKETVVDVRITIERDGSLRGIRMAATGDSTHPDGKGGTTARSRIAMELSWRPRTKRIVAPDPHDVIVVGNLAQARRGATGAWGPQGTLDTMSFARLRELQAAARRADLAARKPRRPARSYPGFFARRRAEMRAFKATVSAMVPFDRQSYVDDPDCEPLWPDTGRSMDRERAASDPDRAGWKCDLGPEVGVVVIMPSPKGITEWRPPSGGSTGFGGNGYPNDF